MALPKKYDFNDYDNYITEPNPTTSAEAQAYFRNTDSIVGALVDTFLWQPETNYANGDVVKSDSMPNGAEAVCVSTNGGKSSNVEPQWGNVGGENIADGTCFWKLRSTNIEEVIEGKRPLKTYTTFEQLGLTSSCSMTELLEAIPANSKFVRYIGTTQYKDFGLPDEGNLEITKGQYVNYANLWLQRYGGDSIARRAYFENWRKGQTTFNWKEIAFLDNGVLPINKGGTGNANGIAPLAEKLNTARYINGILFDGSARFSNYVECTTGASTTEKTVTVENFGLVQGASLRIKFTNGNTASAPTLNVNSTGAKSIMYWGYGLKGGSSELTAYSVYELCYDGTYWRLMNELTMVGATSSKDGARGVVPTPKAGNQTHFLRGDGTWANPATYKLPYATCSTASTTGDKVATISNGVTFALEVGAIVFVKFSNYHNSLPTLNVNSTGAKTVQCKGESATGDYYVPCVNKNGIRMFMYDGTYWQCYENIVYSPDSGGE